MATKKISDLTELTSTAQDDVLAIVDTSASETKKIKVSNLVTGGGDEFFIQVSGAYISGTGSFYMLPIPGFTQTEVTTAQWYSSFPVPANCRLVDVAMTYQRGATGRTINLVAYDNSNAGQGANLGNATNGPLNATSSGGGILQFRNTPLRLITRTRVRLGWA